MQRRQRRFIQATFWFVPDTLRLSGRGFGDPSWSKTRTANTASEECKYTTMLYNVTLHFERTTFTAFRAIEALQCSAFWVLGLQSEVLRGILKLKKHLTHVAQGLGKASDLREKLYRVHRLCNLMRIIPPFSTSFRAVIRDSWGIG